MMSKATDKSQPIFVTINGKEYCRMRYEDGTKFYTVKTERMNQYGRYIWRQLSSAKTMAMIDKAIEELTK